MNKHEVRDTGQALAYITNCALATVCDLAGKKSKSKSEYARQMSIAQTAINWGVQMGVDFSAIRKSVWAPEYRMSATSAYNIAKACCARGSGSVEFSHRESQKCVEEMPP